MPRTPGRRAAALAVFAGAALLALPRLRCRPTFTPGRPSRSSSAARRPAGSTFMPAPRHGTCPGTFPGNPTIVVKNMPGASGARAGYHVAIGRAEQRTDDRRDNARRDRRSPAGRQGDDIVRPFKAGLSGHDQRGRRHLRNHEHVRNQDVRRCVETQDRPGRPGTGCGLVRHRLPREEPHRRPVQHRHRLQRLDAFPARHGTRRDRRHLRMELVERQVAESPIGSATRN